MSSPNPAPKSAYGSKDQISRLLRLVPYLHTHDEVRLAEAAAMFGVSEKQITKDLKVLWMCGLPGGLPDDLIDVDIDALEEPGGDRIIRVANADYLARPLRLSPTEATALIVALRALRDAAGVETQSVIDRALAKLEQAAADAAPLVHPGVTLTVHQAEVEAQIAAAIRDGLQIEVTYYVPSRDEESRRLVDPHDLTFAHGATYLNAWCHSAEAPRWFRLDRIRTVVLQSTPITTAAVERELGVDHLGSSAESATLRLAPQAHWISEYYPMESVRILPEDLLEVDLRVADPQWLIRLALRAAPHVEILAPADYREQFNAAVDRARQLYR